MAESYSVCVFCNANILPVRLAEKCAADYFCLHISIVYFSNFQGFIQTSIIKMQNKTSHNTIYGLKFSLGQQKKKNDVRNSAKN